MGYGTKLQFGVANNLPDPGSYTALSTFDDNKDKNKGIRFGSAHRDYILADEQTNRRSPSPSQYQVQDTLKYPSLSYSLGPRTKVGRTQFINVITAAYSGSRTRPV